MSDSLHAAKVKLGASLYAVVTKHLGETTDVEVGRDIIDCIEKHGWGRKVDVATDIGQRLCVLAGNMMVAGDKEGGHLLACQLQPIMDYLKTHYIPDLPRMETVETILDQRMKRAKQLLEEKALYDVCDGMTDDEEIKSYVFYNARWEEIWQELQKEVS